MSEETIRKVLSIITGVCGFIIALLSFYDLTKSKK